MWIQSLPIISLSSPWKLWEFGVDKSFGKTLKDRLISSSAKRDVTLSFGKEFGNTYERKWSKRLGIFPQTPSLSELQVLYYRCNFFKLLFIDAILLPRYIKLLYVLMSLINYYIIIWNMCIWYLFTFKLL